MQVAEVKTSSSARPTIQAKRQPFFSKEGEGSFFSKSNETSTSFFSPSTIQSKLTIGEPNDKYEVEADAMADKVVQRLATPKLQTNKETIVQAKPIAASVTPLVQTKCTTCDREDKHSKKEEEDLAQELPLKLQRKPIFESNTKPPEDDGNIQRKCAECEKEDEKKLQTKAERTGLTTTTPSLESSLTSSKGGGSPLPENTRTQMEGSFGTDFSRVRVHTDSSAVQMNKELESQAFAHGSDIYFNQGKYDSNSTSGKHLLAHELTHTIQQGATNNSLVQRYSFDDFVNDASNAVDTADQAIDDAGDAIVDVGTAVVETASDVVETVSEVGSAVVDTAENVGEAIVDTASDVGNTVVDTASGAVNWITTTAGQAALSVARSIIGLFGGSISIVGSSIIIDIPDVTLFNSFQEEIGDELPAIPIFEYPIFGGATGAFAFLATLEVNYRPSLLAAIGPGELRNIRLIFNPFSGTFAGQAQLYMAAALGARLSIFGGLVGRGLTVVPTTPPIPILASLGGGIRGTGTGWGIGALSSMINVAYASGGWSFSFNNDIMLGLLLQGDLDLYAFAKVYEILVCEYAHPLGHWETGGAYDINIPVNLGGGKPPSIGPVTAGPMPVQNIETAIEPLSTGLNCKSIQDIVEELCEEGYIPEELCDVLKEIVEDINEIGDEFGDDIGIEPLDLKDCEDLPTKYKYKSYARAEDELKRRLGLPSSTRLFRNNKRATSGPCPRIGRHFNVWDNSGKRGQPLGAIGMCPCTTTDSTGRESRLERFAVLNPSSYGSGGGVGPLAKKWGCTDVRCALRKADKSANCKGRVVGNSDYIYSSKYQACLAAKSDANSKVPRGCYKGHCNCNTKCKQK